MNRNLHHSLMEFVVAKGSIRRNISKNNKFKEGFQINNVQIKFIC